MSNPNIGQDYLNLLLLSTDSCIKLLKSVVFSKTNIRHFTLISLYGTILELVYSIGILAKSDTSIGISVLLRSIVEAHLDLSNLIKDSNYGYCLHAEYLTQWNNVLKSAQSGDNLFLKDFSKHPNLTDRINETRAQIEDLKSKGFTPLSKRKKFEKANLDHAYSSFYNFLCCDSHNDLRSLYERHTWPNPEGTDFQMQCFAPIDLNEIVPEIDTCIGALLNSTENIHTYFKAPQNTDLPELFRKLNTLRTECGTA